MLLSIVVVVAVLAALVFYFGRAKLCPGIPHSSFHHPFFGSLLEVFRNKDRIALWKNQWMKEVVETHKQGARDRLAKTGVAGQELDKQVKAPSMLQWSYPFWSSSLIEILTPAGLKCMLSDNFNSFTKGDLVHDVFEETLGGGIFRVDGEQWRHQRKVASHMFSFAKLTEFMLEVFLAESEKLVAYLAKVAQTGEVIDFQALMFDFTFESICRIACGVQIDQLGSKTPHPFCRAFDEVQFNITDRSFTPPAFWKAKRFLNIGSEKTFRGNLAIVHEFVAGIIADRRKNALEHADSGDLLSLFINDALKRGEEPSDQMMRETILNFMVAGRDTTAVALTWLFYALDQNPLAESVCAQEVAAKLDKNIQPTAESLRGLIQIEAAFLEATRLWSPVPTDVKQCVQDCTFPCGTKIKAGYSPHFLNRLPDFYAASSGLQGWASDCEVFRPSRWIVPAGGPSDDKSEGEEGEAQHAKEKILQPSAYDFVTFNAGLRLCLGKSMAQLESKVVASSILQHFRIRVQKGFVPQQRISVVYLMAHGLPVTVETRTAYINAEPTPQQTNTSPTTTTTTTGAKTLFLRPPFLPPRDHSRPFFLVQDLTEVPTQLVFAFLFHRNLN